MLLRSLFWIAVVLVLMPREPGLPTHAAALATVQATLGDIASESGAECNPYATICETGSKIIDAVRSAAIANLIRVKVEIRESERAPIRSEIGVR